MVDMSRTGGCQCGAVRYGVRAAAQDLYHCHCGMCRKVHGALFASFAVVPRDAFCILRGADNISVFDSSPGVHRYFCRTCGCPLYCDVDDRPEVRYYTAGTLDGGADPGHPAASERHIYVASKAPWFRIGDGLPQFEEN